MAITCSQQLFQGCLSDSMRSILNVSPWFEEKAVGGIKMKSCAFSAFLRARSVRCQGCVYVCEHACIYACACAQWLSFSF